MKASMIFILAFCGSSQSYISELSHGESVTVQAAFTVISDSFSPDLPVHIIKSSDITCQSLANQIAANLSQNTTVVRLSDLDNLQQDEDKRLQNVIIMSENKSFEKLIKAIEGEHFAHQGLFLIVMTKTWIKQHEDLENLFSMLWKNYVANANVLIPVDRDQLQMYTFYPFTPTICGEAFPTHINTFVNGSFTQMTLHFNDKVENLFACPLKVVTFDVGPMMFLTAKPGGSFSISGIDAELLKGEIHSSLFVAFLEFLLVLALAGRINFTIDLIDVTEDGKWGTYEPNGTSTGAIGVMVNKQADFAMGKFGLTLRNTKILSPSISYISFPLVVVIPPGEPYNPLEKLTKPFRAEVWIFVLIFLALGFATITVVRLCNGKVQDFVFGEANYSPHVNLVKVFLGDSLTHLPTRNFARTLLFMFILYCFVIGNAYTGSLFSFIQANHLKPIPKTIDEMIAKGFTFYMTPPAARVLSDATKIYQNRKVISMNEWQETERKLTNPHFKGGLISSFEQFHYYNSLAGQNSKLEICPELLLTLQFTIYFQKNSFLVNRFDREILGFSSNGMINMLVDKYLKKKLTTAGEHEPKALQLDQVMGSLWLLMFGILLSCIVAVVELLIKTLQDRKRNIFMFDVK